MSQGVYTGKDRRQSVRFRFDAAVKVEHEGRSFDALGTDFNDDAISIIHEEALPVGASVTLSVVDELGNTIEMKGEVARIKRNDGDELYSMVIQRIQQSSE